MRYPHILSALRSEPWFITPDAFQAIADVVQSRLAASPTMADILPPARPSGAEPEKEPAPDSPPGVALIRAHGILGKHLGLMERMCGGCDYDSIVQQTATSLGDPAVSAGVLHVQSPGGMSVGSGEAFDALRAIRAQTGKPLIGFVDGQCCSAGYYLLAACDAIVMTRSAQLGSIGCMITLEDRSGALEQARIKRYTFKSGTMKDIGNPDRAPTPEEVATIQARVDQLGGMFSADMAAARPQIAAEVFETSLSYFGQEALSRGLADEMVPDLQHVLLSLAKPASV